MSHLSEAEQKYQYQSPRNTQSYRYVVDTFFVKKKNNKKKEKKDNKKV